MKRLLYYTKSYHIHIILAALASVVCSVVNVKVIDILQRVIDKTMVGELGNGFVVLLFQIGVVVGLGLLANYLVVASTGYFGAGVLRDLRNDSLNHLMKISPASMEENNLVM